MAEEEEQLQTRILHPSNTESVSIRIPNTPLLSEIFPQNLQKWPSKVLFKGWKQPQKQWKEWVDRLAPRYSTIWTQIGIHDAIMSSTYEFKCNPDLVLGLSQFWCPETNTFVFPWGEATITLQDVTILSGLPVLGDSVPSQLSDGSVEVIAEELEKQRIKLNRTKSKKPSHGQWINNFMQEETEYEHAGFLTLWLSRFVFTSLPDQTIQKNLFPIAANLSLGKPIALGIALLASIYHDLTTIYNDTMSRKESISVIAPFQLLQMWVLEHFPVLLKGYGIDTNSKDALNPGEPRVAQWNNVNLDLPFVQSAPQIIRSILEDANKFVWLPYGDKLENIFKGTELVGLDCKEKYSPQRVAMQFGMDQDLPADQGFERDSCDGNMGFLVPPRSLQAGFSERYLKWWKEMMIARKGMKLQGKYAKFSEFLRAHCSPEHLLCTDSSSTSSSEESLSEKSSDSGPSLVAPRFPLKRNDNSSSNSSDDDHIPIATSFKLRHGYGKNTCIQDQESTSEVNVVQLANDNSSRMIDVTSAAVRNGLNRGAPELPPENVEVNVGETSCGKNDMAIEVETEVLVEDIRDGSESADATKSKNVEGSASKSVDHLNYGIDKGVPEVPAKNMELNEGKTTLEKNDVVAKEVMMELSEAAKVIRESSESDRVAKRQNIGESTYKPAELDNGMGIASWGHLKRAQELKKRVDNLEKLLSQVHEIFKTNEKTSVHRVVL